MRIPRVYQDAALINGQNLSLSVETAHHLINVLRMKQGQMIYIFNGQGGYFEATIKLITKRQIEIIIGEYHDVENESQLYITLAQGISRGQRMDYTLQKAVELGVSRIVPIMCQYGNVKLDKQQQQKRIDHWQKIIIGACEQSGRNRLPLLNIPVNFTDWINEESSGLKILLHPSRENSLDMYQPKNNHIILLAGPEGGFSDPEVESAIKCGFNPVTLGPRVLRTETIALAAITASQVLWGDMH